MEFHTILSQTATNHEFVIHEGHVLFVSSWGYLYNQENEVVTLKDNTTIQTPADEETLNFISKMYTNNLNRIMELKDEISKQKEILVRLDKEFLFVGFECGEPREIQFKTTEMKKNPERLEFFFSVEEIEEVLNRMNKGEITHLDDPRETGFMGYCQRIR